MQTLKFCFCVHFWFIVIELGKARPWNTKGFGHEIILDDFDIKNHFFKNKTNLNEFSQWLVWNKKIMKL